MSPITILIACVVALALAVQSFRVLVDLEPARRPGRLALLFVAAGLGLLVVHSLEGWDYAALGCVGGLAVVELGPKILELWPVVVDLFKRIAGRKGGEP